MSHKISYPIPPTGEFLFPESLEQLGGPAVQGKAEINSRRGDRGVGRLTFVERGLSWLNDFEHFVFQVLADGTHKAIRKATQEDIWRFRVPIWIQGEAVPTCCDREMKGRSGILYLARSSDQAGFLSSALGRFSSPLVGAGHSD
jgi:hypothetical protein